MHPGYTFFFFFNDTATTEIYTLSLHDALPIWHLRRPRCRRALDGRHRHHRRRTSRVEPELPVLPHLQHRHARRSEEHTSELQSPCNLVCRLLLEKKKTI